MVSFRKFMRLVPRTIWPVGQDNIRSEIITACGTLEGLYGQQQQGLGLPVDEGVNLNPDNAGLSHFNTITTPLRSAAESSIQEDFIALHGREKVRAITTGMIDSHAVLLSYQFSHATHLVNVAPRLWLVTTPEHYAVALQEGPGGVPRYALMVTKRSPVPILEVLR